MQEDKLVTVGCTQHERLIAARLDSDLERKAERTLMVHTHRLSPEALAEFLDSIGLCPKEYQGIADKYALLMKEYDKEISNGNNPTPTTADNSSTETL